MDLTQTAPRAGGRAAVIEGLGSWLPPTVVTNGDLAARLDTSDEWIRERTGIGERRRVDPGMATGDLAVEAGRRALRAAGQPGVDAVVLGTTTPDRRCPGTAPEVASRLGLTGAAAFDVNAVCTGFVYALASAAGLIAAGAAARVLVVGAEAFSTILDPEDRTTAAIFGDGAGAIVLRAGDPDEPGALGPFVLGSDGEQAELIMVPAGGSRQRSAGTPAGPKDHYFTMNGRHTYRHAVAHLTEACTEALGRAGWDLDELDRLAAHQANARIIDAVAGRLGLDNDRVLMNIGEVGNTAAASVPILLAESGAAGRLKAGHRTLITAFGGGLTWGATTVLWPDVVCVTD